MKKLLSIILSITMLLSMATVAFAEETTTSGAREVEGIIKVGVNAEFPPFEYIENDKIIGFDIDLMNYIAARIGYGVEFVNMPFDKLIPAVVNGEVDCAISAITRTAERREVVDFSRPYLRATITQNNGEASTKNQELYSIVFKDGMSDTLLKSSFPTDEEKKYLLITGALDELISDGTVDKLIEKYNLNKALEEDTKFHYEYDTVKGSQSPAAKTDTEITKSEEMTMITVPAPSEWAAKDIDFAYAMGITDNNKQYIYQSSITREEFCELIYNLVTLVKSEITAPIKDNFTDTENEKILMLNGLGIINGKSATEFAPDDYLTREEAAAIIIRMVNKVMPMAATEMWFEYEDMAEVSQWAVDSIQTISNLGFMRGVDNNKFAPKETYTTEQAITTLVRVYKGAEAAGIVNGNISDEIIGGADTPTEIVVTDTISLDDFYINEAIKLTEESGKLAGDKDFIRYYTANTDMTEKIAALANVNLSEPAEIYYMAADREKIAENIKALLGDEAEGFDIEKLLELNKVDFSVLANLINASYGAENLAALTILTNSRGYIMPEDFEEEFALFLKYDGEYSVLVSFSIFGEGVIRAQMTFVKNGYKDNIFARIYEITQGLGEDSIKIALVE